MGENDQLGFEIYYLWQGQTKTYYPDYIIKVSKNNRYLPLRLQTTEQDKAKWQAAKEWVVAVNASGSFELGSLRFWMILKTYLRL